MTDPLTMLTRALSGRYTIERELGRGGMATVYLAHDLKHDRPVALKVLHPEVAAALGSERFLREIRFTANLNHPHILPLLDSGRLTRPTRLDDAESGGRGELLYYVMPFVEGESLRDRLTRDAQLPLDEALKITGDVCAALAYAHSRGIVHRDIKPENLLLASGEAVVADFGIARALDAAGGERLTGTGLAIGTPAYMSPEQASGDPVDPRSDIYALGCVVYEMLAGEPPYTGPTAQAILAKRLSQPVPHVSTLRETVPPQIEDAISRALARSPADRFATARDFAAALANTSDSRAGHAAGRAAGPPAARSIRASRLMLPGLVVLLAGGWMLWRYLHRAADPRSTVVAVFPPVAVEHDPVLDPLARNLAVTLSANLDGVGEIRTIDALTILARTRQGIALTEDAASLGRQLGAGSIVTGTLVREGALVRLDLAAYASRDRSRLTRVTSVRAPPDSIAALTDSATWGLLRELWRRGTPPSPTLAALTTRSMPALRAFLEGEHAIVQGDWQEAESAFARATAADSTFWWAHLRRAYASGWLEEQVDTGMLGRIRGHLAQLPERERMLASIWLAPPHQSIPLARELVHRYPDYWPGQFEYADRLAHAGPLWGLPISEAEAALKTALTLNSDLVPAWNHLAIVAAVSGDTTELGLAVASWERLGMRDWFLQWTRTILHLARGHAFAGPMVDSLIDASATMPAVWMSFAFSVIGYPAAQFEFTGRLLGRQASAEDRAEYWKGLALAWAARGAWDSAVSTHDEYRRRLGSNEALLDAGRLRVLGVWLGALDTVVAGSLQTDLERVRPRLGPEQQTELSWLEGMRAWMRRDQERLAQARQSLQGSADESAPVVDRSLAAYGLQMTGFRREAAESLAALEFDRNGMERPGWDVHPYLMGINRLAAARWLAAEGELERAARLLLWPQAIFSDPSIANAVVVLGGLSYLELARIEATRGERDLARKYYRMFLQRYDQPASRLRPLADEARELYARLRASEK